MDTVSLAYSLSPADTTILLARSMLLLTAYTETLTLKKSGLLSTSALNYGFLRLILSSHQLSSPSLITSNNI